MSRTIRIRSRTHIAAATMCVLIGTGCSVNPTPPPVPRLNPNSNVHQQIMAAMVSVLAHAYWPHGDTAAKLHSLSLPQVTDILTDPRVEQVDSSAPSRRRRAIATLAAYGLGIPRFEVALRDLGADVEAIKSAAREQERLLGAAFSQNATARETFIADLPEVSGASSIGSCTWMKLSTSVSGNGPDISVNVEVTASNSLQYAAMGMDPQSWDDCGIGWKTGDGTYLAHLDSGNHVVPDPLVNPPGSPYSNRSLFEHFLCRTGLCNVSFKLMLNVTTSQTGARYDAGYSLPPGGCLEGYINGQPETLRVDYGILRAEPLSAGGVRARGEKTFGFQDSDTTAIVLGVLQNVELSKQLAELVCCFSGGLSPPQLIDVEPLP